MMSVEQRIRRIEEAIRTTLENRDWLRSAEWRDSRNADPDLVAHLDDAIDQHEQALASYEKILSTLRAR